MINQKTTLRCVNPLNTQLKPTVYEGRMYRTRGKQLSVTTSYANATFFETKNSNGKVTRYHILRFMPV